MFVALIGGAGTRLPTVAVVFSFTYFWTRCKASPSLGSVFCTLSRLGITSANDYSSETKSALDLARDSFEFLFVFGAEKPGRNQLGAALGKFFRFLLFGERKTLDP
jgi:hypothetical protein